MNFREMFCALKQICEDRAIWPTTVRFFMHIQLLHPLLFIYRLCSYEETERCLPIETNALFQDTFSLVKFYNIAGQHSILMLNLVNKESRTLASLHRVVFFPLRQHLCEPVSTWSRISKYINYEQRSVQNCQSNMQHPNAMTNGLLSRGCLRWGESVDVIRGINGLDC